MELSSTGAAAAPALSPSEIFRGRKLLHPRQHRLRGQGAAQHAARPVPRRSAAPTSWCAAAPGPTASRASGRAWSPRRPSTRCATSSAARRRLAAFLREKVVVVDGDITEPNLGMSEELADGVAKDIDVLINSSGRVTFNPPLESALRTNVQGTKNVIAFAKRMKRPALIHTSTCFVAGNRSGEVWEDEELDGYFPRHKELSGTRFSVEQEIADSALGRGAHPPARRRRPGAGGAAPAGPRPAARGEPRSRRRAGAEAGGGARRARSGSAPRLTKQGVERAAKWGWPNIYTYTKSMGDQLVARETGIVRAIVRPAIVESAVAYPFRGWNEGFTTSAPLVYLALKGQNLLPVSPKLILDVVPGRSRRVGDADGRGAGDRRAAQAGVPAVERRPQPAAHGSRRHPDRPLQAEALPRQGDREPLPQRAGGADGVPSGHAGDLRPLLASRCSRALRARPPRRWRASARAGARGASPR